MGRRKVVAENGALVAATNTTIYTVPTGMNADITHISAHNTDAASAVQVTVNIVESGGSVGALNERVVVNIAPETNEVLYQLYNKTLDPGTFVSVIADSASKVSLDLSVVEYTQ